MVLNLGPGSGVAQDTPKLTLLSFFCTSSRKKSLFRRNDNNQPFLAKHEKKLRTSAKTVMQPKSKDVTHISECSRRYGAKAKFFLVF